MTDFTIYNNQPRDIALHGRGMVDISRLKEESSKGSEHADQSDSSNSSILNQQDLLPEIEQYIKQEIPHGPEIHKSAEEPATEEQVYDERQMDLFNTPKEKKPAASESKGPVTITILHTNDIHGNILPKTDIVAGNNLDNSEDPVEFGGEPVMASLIHQEREKAAMRGESLLLLDAGDMFMGTPITGLFHGKPMIEIMNEEKYDAAAVGNHDFDWGTHAFNNLAEEANFPFLAANATNGEGKPLQNVKPFVIRELPGVKVGIVGIASPETNTITNQEDVKRMEFEDPVSTLQRVIPEMRKQGAELIVVLSHAGLDEDVRMATELRNQNISLIVGGHSHNTLLEPVKIGDTYIGQTGAGGTSLGKINLTWDPEKKKVTGGGGNLIRAYKDAASPDVDVENIISKYKAKEEEVMSVNLGKVDEDLIHPSNGEETNLGDLVTDMMREKTGAQIALLNSGCLRTNLLKGEISYRDVYNVLPFPSKIVKLEMKGKDIMEVLERSAGTEDDKSMQVSGLKVVYDSLQPEGQRLLMVRLADGTRIKPDDTYTVATIDYLAQGGDQYTAFTRSKALDTDSGLLQHELAVQLSEMGLLNEIITNRRIDTRCK